MSIQSPENRVWWNEPIEKTELTWIAIAFAWCLIMFGTMIYWHLYGEQNLSTETYRIEPTRFAQQTEAFAEQYGIGEYGDTGVPLVEPPPGGDAFMFGRLWEWWPVLQLKKGETYRLHLSSLDWQHGFSLQPVNINIQIHPGYDYVVTLKPNKSGDFSVICNEYCGIGHHQMIGRIVVVD